jgi:hypothetical protein
MYDYCTTETLIHEFVRNFSDNLNNSDSNIRSVGGIIPGKSEYGDSLGLATWFFFSQHFKGMAPLFIYQLEYNSDRL